MREVVRGGTRTGGPVGIGRTVEATGWTPVRSERSLLGPTDAVETGVTTGLRLPKGPVDVRRLSGVPVDVGTDAGDVNLPHRAYLVRVGGSTTTLVRFRGAARLVRATRAVRTTLSFDDPTEVTVGVRLAGEDPPGTVTVPRTPAGVAAGLSYLSAGHRTASPARSLPSMRGPPPRLAFGPDIEVPDAVAGRREESAVEVVLPADLRYLFTAAPLAYYLGAGVRVDADAAPEMRLPGRVHEFSRLPAFQREVSTTLRRVFLLDCLVRTAGTDVAETRHLDALGLDADALADRVPADRVEAYLDAPFERVADDLPDWHLSMYVDPAYGHVPTLSHLLPNVPHLFLPEVEPLETRERLRRSLDDFYRSEGPIAGVDPVKPVLGPGRSHGWLADGVPIDVFKSVPDVYERRPGRDRSGTLSIVTVLNDASMAGEFDDVARLYRDHADGLDVAVSVERDLSVDELADVFRSDHGLVHYIGHCEAAGLRCRDGHFSAASLEGTDVDTFFLNACGSFHEGLDLVRSGSVAGAVTFDKVLDRQATRVGTTFVRLLIHGFSIQRALRLARRRIMMGKDYAVVGDGTHRPVRPSEEVPVAARVESVDEGYRVSCTAETPRVTGGCYRPPLRPDGPARLLGATEEAVMTAAELESFLEGVDIPVIHDGDIQWSDELARTLR